MKKYLISCLLACSIYGSAEQVKEPSSNRAPMLCVRNNKDSLFKVGANYNYLWLKPKGFDSFTGSLGGAQVSYEYLKTNRFYGAGLLVYRQGDTTDASSKKEILNFNTQERLGYTFGDCNWSISVFSGFGFVYLQHDLKQTGFSTLKFKYKEFYVPLGFLLTGRPAQCLTLGLDFTWMPQVYPAVQINPTGVANWEIDYKINNFLVEIPITFNSPSCPSLLCEIRPTFEYWNDGKTKTSSTGININVPANRYIYAGVQVNFGYLF